MGIGEGISVFSVCAVVVVAIIKFIPKVPSSCPPSQVHICANKMDNITSEITELKVSLGRLDQRFADFINGKTPKEK